MHKTKPDFGLIEKSLMIFRCPACFNEALKLDTDDGIKKIICQNCQTRFPIAGGIIDFFPQYVSSKSLSQKFMENRYVVKMYEKYFRPAFTRLGSPIKYREEENWLKKCCENHQAPTVLDIASGTGKYARLIADACQPEMVIAFDLSMPMLEKNIEISMAGGYRNIVYIKGDAMCLPFRDHTMDHINCFGALHLFPDAFTSIKEISRVGRDNAIFTCLTACQQDGFMSRWFQKIFSKVASFKFFDIVELERNLKNLGFSNFEYVAKKMLLMFVASLKK